MAGLWQGPGLNKWIKFFDMYHRHFSRFRDQGQVVLVEVRSIN